MVLIVVDVANISRQGSENIGDSGHAADAEAAAPGADREPALLDRPKSEDPAPRWQSLLKIMNHVVFPDSRRGDMEVLQQSRPALAGRLAGLIRIIAALRMHDVDRLERGSARNRAPPRVVGAHGHG